MGVCGKRCEHLKVETCVFIEQWEIPQSGKTQHSTQTCFERKEAVTVDVLRCALKGMEKLGGR